MLNFLIAFVIGSVAPAPLNIFYQVPLLYCGMISVVIFGVIYFLLSRRTMNKVMAIVQSAQHDMQANRSERALATLQDGFKYAKWQFYVKGQVNAQIGTLLYIKKDFAKALPYLQKSIVRHWVAMCMLAVCYMKRSNPTKMALTFEKAIAASRKEAFIWNLYAYCQDKIGEHDSAIATLKKGIKKLKGSENLEASLEAIQSGKRMRMEDYGDIWYQFHLEKTGTLVKKQTKAAQGRRKIPRV
jgi:tetratricopeptide (TPR) repeat protein